MLEFLGRHSCMVPLGGQTVTIEWAGYGGAYIVESSSHYTHWTGEYLGPSTPAVPECQSEGQGCNSMEKKSLALHSFTKGSF